MTSTPVVSTPVASTPRLVGVRVVELSATVGDPSEFGNGPAEAKQGNTSDTTWATMVKGASPSPAVNPWDGVEVEVEVANRSAKGVLQVAGRLMATSKPIEGTEIDGQKVSLGIGVVASFVWDASSDLDHDILANFVRTTGLRVILPYLRSNAEDLTNRLRVPLGPLDLVGLELGEDLVAEAQHSS